MSLKLVRSLFAKTRKSYIKPSIFSNKLYSCYDIGIRRLHSFSNKTNTLRCKQNNMKANKYISCRKNTCYYWSKSWFSGNKMVYCYSTFICSFVILMSFRFADWKCCAKSDSRDMRQVVGELDSMFKKWNAAGDIREIASCLKYTVSGYKIIGYNNFNVKRPYGYVIFGNRARQFAEGVCYYLLDIDPNEEAKYHIMIKQLRKKYKTMTY
eukprot:378269_1